MRWFDRLLVVVYVALAAVPVVAMGFKIRGRALYGVLEPTPRPVLELDAVLAEKYQHGFTSWFESNLGLKGNSIALDNAILYHAFGETKFGATLQLGEGGVLFSLADLNFHNKPTLSGSDRAYLEQLVERIARLQQRFAARGKALVPVIVPSKTSIYRDKIPPRWVVELPEPRPADETMRIVRHALDRLGVRYVDAVAVLEHSPIPREYLFGTDARHWSSHGACLTMSAITTAFADILHVPRPPHACRVTFARTNPKIEEYDLWRLLNAQWTYRTIKRMPGVDHPRDDSTQAAVPKPSVLFVGTSFCWTIMFDAEDSGVFGPTHLNYYNRTFAASDGERAEMAPASARWRELTLDKDLVVLDLFESYLGAPGAYVDLFLRDVEAASEPASEPVPDQFD